jgi:hypothetical protein
VIGEGHRNEAGSSEPTADAAKDESRAQRLGGKTGGKRDGLILVSSSQGAEPPVGVKDRTPWMTLNECFPAHVICGIDLEYLRQCRRGHGPFALALSPSILHFPIQAVRYARGDEIK